MIAYCPLDEVEPAAVVNKKQRATVLEEEPKVGREETELNYVVMAFIVGVVMLAFTDAMKD